MAAVALLATAPALAGVSRVDGGIEFTFDHPSAGSVSLAGDFNGWNMNAEPLTQDEDGVWRVVVDLGPGEHAYKFVVNGSEWIADPENPMVVGDFGNSGVIINDDGDLVSEEEADPISNTSVNSRVQLNGWYRATYDWQAELPSDPRWRLNRPAHEFFIAVNPTVTSVASGNATVRLSTGAGDIKEISADIYSGHLTLEGGPFSVTGFYNEERLQYDNPLETVGHIDLDGTIPEEHISFGRGAQGIMLDTEFWDFTLDAAYANIYDYYIMNDPSVYDNTGTDLLAARLKRTVGPATLGATYTSRRDGWWIGFEGTNTSPHIDEYLANGPDSLSSWFELSNTETWIGLDANMPIVSDLLYAKAEYSFYSYDSLFDVANKAKIEGEDYSNGAVDIPVGSMDGWIATGVLESSPLPYLDLRLQITKTAIDSMSPGEQYVAFGSPYWLGVREGVFTEVTGTSSPLSVNIFMQAPEREELEFKFDANAWFGIFDMGFEYDRADFEWSYGQEIVGHFGSLETWKERTSRLSVTGGADVAERIRVGFATERISGYYDVDDLEDPSRFEVLLTADVGLWQDWSMLLDVRSASYTNIPRFAQSTPDSLHYEDEAFLAPYVALVYSPRENIEVRVGYGVDPTNYADTPVEGRGDGRERWLSQYLWDHSGHDVLDAEKALADAKTIGVMAVITF
jgi:hypothetical protein